MTTARRNIEIKARARDLPSVRAAALALGAQPLASEHQTDTYFAVPTGRLKLRQRSACPLTVDSAAAPAATLIGYRRQVSAAARLSQYHLVPIEDPEAIKAWFASLLGIRAVVRKAREILLYQNVRIHLDRVDRLGTFLELEAVLAPGEDAGDAGDAAEEQERESRELVRSLTQRLGMAHGDLIGESYVDLLETGPA